MLSIGTINSNIIHPREVFKAALEYNAAAVILVHNHPSGNLTPSQADKDLTKSVIGTFRPVAGMPVTGTKFRTSKNSRKNYRT
jgi:DNA repair protein RadC